MAFIESLIEWARSVSETCSKVSVCLVCGTGGAWKVLLATVMVSVTDSVFLSESCKAVPSNSSKYCYTVSEGSIGSLETFSVDPCMISFVSTHSDDSRMLALSIREKQDSW